MLLCQRYIWQLLDTADRCSAAAATPLAAAVMATMSAVGDAGAVADAEAAAARVFAATAAQVVRGVDFLQDSDYYGSSCYFFSCCTSPRRQDLKESEPSSSEPQDALTTPQASPREFVPLLLLRVDMLLLCAIAASVATTAMAADGAAKTDATTEAATSAVAAGSQGCRSLPCRCWRRRPPPQYHQQWGRHQPRRCDNGSLCLDVSGPYPRQQLAPTSS